MSKQYDLIATCAFGLERLVKDELIKLGLRITKTENGRVHFTGDESAIVKANLWLRCADRVLLKVAEFKALTWDELFEATKALPWEDFIPENGVFPVSKATSVDSKLFSKSDSQAIVKKAVVERLGSVYDVEWFEETGARYPIYFNNLKDTVTLSIDTTGAGLHKRGYREQANEAPLRETLAAALVYLSKWNMNKTRVLADPLCGSGTILIEAAMIGKNMAPGLKREFLSETWEFISESTWKTERSLAYKAINKESFQLVGSDINPDTIEIARGNAELAGVSELIEFSELDVKDFKSRNKYGLIITNPPYGERIGDEEFVEELYGIMGDTFRKLPDWTYFILTSYTQFDQHFESRYDKNRKLFNGRIQVRLFQFFGPLPPRKKGENK
jgi:putative N6-adenine-specific DNA methylase